MNWFREMTKRDPFPLQKKFKLSLRISSIEVPKLPDLVIYTEEILNGNFIFCSAFKSMFPFISIFYFTTVVLKKGTTDTKWNKKYPKALPLLDCRSR